MKTGFKNPADNKDGKKVKNPWNFDQPQYDERSSCYINAGTCQGVGTRQPVGHKGNPKSEGVPQGRVNTLETGYIHTGRPTNVEIERE